jgi:pimeloyl-ACP methyl ester carboxylesterase
VSILKERAADADQFCISFADEYAFEHHYLETPAGLLHYVDEGPRDASPILCVHGNPTWSFYYRRLIQKFRGEQRVIAPDHIGCGLSDKPQDWSYRLADHIDNLERLVLELDLRDITLVVHDWGGAIGCGVATRHPERFARILVMNTAAFPGGRIPTRIRACRTPILGELAVRGLNGFARAAIEMAVENASVMTPEVRKGYLAPYDTWANRIAVQRFVEDIPLSADHPSYETLQAIDSDLRKLRGLPVAIVWGEQDWCFTPKFREQWERRFPMAQQLTFEDAGHYVLEEAHDRILPWVAEWQQQS